MLPLLGIGDRLHPELDAPFLQEADNTATPMPTAATLAAQWAEVNGALQAGFDRFTPADWSARHTAMSDADFTANPLRNRLAVLLSRTGHVAYHLGQCALAPKAASRSAPLVLCARRSDPRRRVRRGCLGTDPVPRRKPTPTPPGRVE